MLLDLINSSEDPLLVLVLIFILVVQVFIPGFPKEIVLVQAGLSFGFILGSLINWLGMVIGAQVGYEVVRRSVRTGGSYSMKLQNFWDSHWMVKIQEKGNFGLFLLRLVPYAPNDVLSLLSGAVKLPRRGFVLVSLVTAIPYALLFAFVGSIGRNYLDPGALWIANGVLSGIGLSVALLVHLKQRVGMRPGELAPNDADAPNG